jgi:hypothetical protein
MKSLIACSLVALFTFTGGAHAAGPTKKVIDTFNAGPFQRTMPSAAAGWGVNYQNAKGALGDVRQTNVFADDTLGASSSIIIRNGRMLISTGIGSYFGTMLGYGYDAAGNSNHMVADFAGCTHFQIDFERNDVDLEYLVEVVDGNGTTALAANVLTGQVQSDVYAAQLALDDFEGTDAQGNPRAIEWSKIHYLIVLFQSASAVGGNDFSVSELSAVGCN